MELYGLSDAPCQLLFSSSLCLIAFILVVEMLKIVESFSSWSCLVFRLLPAVEWQPTAYHAEDRCRRRLFFPYLYNLLLSLMHHNALFCSPIMCPTYNVHGRPYLLVLSALSSCSFHSSIIHFCLHLMAITYFILIIFYINRVYVSEVNTFFFFAM